MADFTHYKNVQTPCIGICSTVYGDDICRGCKRHFKEVIDWNSFADTKKASILQRLDNAVVAGCQNYFDISDIKRLKASASAHQLHYNEDASDYLVAFLLLHTFTDEITSATDCGLSVKPSYAAWSLRQLVDTVDTEIYRVGLLQLVLL